MVFPEINYQKIKILISKKLLRWKRNFIVTDGDEVYQELVDYDKNHCRNAGI